MRNLDVDDSGTIDYEEFLAATISQSQMNKDANLLAAFSYFDKDNSGTISPDEIRKALGIDSSDKHLNSLIAEVDENGDGEIQFDEFCNMMRKLTL